MIGVAPAPGAFIAKRLAGRLTLDQYTWILDGVVVLGGVGLIAQGLRTLDESGLAPISTVEQGETR